MKEDGPEWPLDKRKTFVENKLMIAFKANETLLELHRPIGHSTYSHLRLNSASGQPSSSGSCYYCGQQGHWASHCPRRFQRSTGKGYPSKYQDRPSWNQGHWKTTYPKGGGGPNRSPPKSPTGISPYEKDRRRSLDLCLHCGQAGHRWHKCPVGSQQFDRRQSHIEDCTHQDHHYQEISPKEDHMYPDQDHLPLMVDHSEDHLHLLQPRVEAKAHSKDHPKDHPREHSRVEVMEEEKVLL